MVTLAVVADLHVDLLRKDNRDALIFNLAKLERQEAWDYLIIAGDIANHHSKVLPFIDQLSQQLTAQVYFIPGNHDYWSQDEDSWAIYQLYRDHPQCLMGQPLVLNDQWGLVGHSLWYDHSGSRKAYSEAFLERGVYQGYRWEDKIYVRWQETDRRVASYFLDQLLADFNQVKRDHYLLISHFVTHPALQIPDDPAYQASIDYFNAFISTTGLEEFAHKYSIPYHLMGHVHHRKVVKEQGRVYATCCLGTEREWLAGTSLASNLAQAIYRITID